MKFYLKSGLEIHAVLFGPKMFSAANVDPCARANTQVCAFDIGEPGTLPLLPNITCVHSAIRACLALNCQINHQSTFDRKHYSYYDLPSGFQITQQRIPLSNGGLIQLRSGQTLKIKRVHLEHDTATSKMNFNRSGWPLVEIITEPIEDNDGKVTIEILNEIRLRLFLAKAIALPSKFFTPLRTDVNVSKHNRETDDILGSVVEYKNISRSNEIRKVIRQFEISEDSVTAHRAGSIFSKRKKEKYIERKCNSFV